MIATATEHAANDQIQGSGPAFDKPFSLINIGDFLRMDEMQALFEGVPLDPYVKEGFRRKSLFRARISRREVVMTDHAPLYQPVAFNPVHGGIYRHYQAMEARLAALLFPVVNIFAACAGLDHSDEILVQAQRITASEGQTGFPVVEGWHRDDIKVLGLLLVNRVNVSGGISMLSFDRGENMAFAQTLVPGDFLLVNDQVMWHNTTPIKQIRADQRGFRDIVIVTSPTNRPPEA